jgi:dipeptide/tripeptide permease
LLLEGEHELPTIRSQQLSVAFVVSLALTIQTFVSLLAAATPVLAPAILAERGWATTLVAFYPALVGLTQFAISFVAPQLLSILGGLGLCLACLLLSAVGLVWTLAPSLFLVALTPLFIGAAVGSMNPASSELLGPRTTARTAGLIMSIKQTGVPLGALFAGLAIPALLGHFGWPLAVATLSSVGAALALLLFWWRPNVDEPAQGAVRKPSLSLDSVRELFLLPDMKRIVLASLTFSAMQVCLRSFLPVYLVLEIGGTLSLAGAALTASQASGMVGQIFWAALSDRVLRTRTVLALAGLAMTIGALLTASITPQWEPSAIVAVSALYGLGASGFQIVTLPGVFAGPLIFGIFASYLGLASAFWIFALCSLGCSILLVYPGRTHALDRADESNLHVGGRPL